MKHTKINKLKRSLLFIVLLMGGMNSFAQIDTSFHRIAIPFDQYLGLVAKNNLGYAAEKFNVNIADAGIEIAKVFPDPQLTFGWFDNGQKRMKQGYGFNTSLSATLEMGGKRRARIDLAANQSELTKALLEDYFRNLRADATLGYLQALQQKNTLYVKLNSYQQVKKLAVSDSIRYKLGAIMEIDARQSNLEAGSLLNDVFQSEADWKTSLVNLSTLLGKHEKDSLYYPEGDFSKFDRNFELYKLIDMAETNRADLVAALKNQAVSQSMLKLAKANRVLDLGLNFGANHAAVVANAVSPTPSMNTLSAGISIPLRFSNKYRGEMHIAQYTIKQTKVQYMQVALQIRTEVTQAYYNYIAAGKQVKQFKTGLLNEAQKVLDGKIYSYKRGQTSLLEVLNAQRTYNDVQQDYYQTQYNYAAALVELERAAGIWDINF